MKVKSANTGEKGEGDEFIMKKGLEVMVEIEGSYLWIGNRTDYMALAAVGITCWIRDLIWHNAVRCIGGEFSFAKKALCGVFASD